MYSKNPLLTESQALTYLCSAFGIIFLIWIWYSLSFYSINHGLTFPSPNTIYSGLIHLLNTEYAGGFLHEHTFESLKKYSVGFLLAIITGIPLGLIMGWFKRIDYIITPFFDGLRFIPPIAWVPFAAIWFGTHPIGPILIIFIGALPPCIINSYRGAKYIEKNYIEASLMLGLSTKTILLEVLLPSALPSIMAGVRVSASVAWMCLIGAELLSPSNGLGSMMVKAQSSANLEIVIIGMIIIGIVGLLIDFFLNYLNKFINTKYSA